MRQRSGRTAAAGGQRPIRHEVKRIWTDVKATNWLEEQRHQRKNGAPAAASPKAPAVATVTDIGTRKPKAAVASLKRFVPDFRSAASAGGNGSGSAPSSPAASPPKSPQAPPARRQAPVPPGPAAPQGAPPGRNQTVTGNGSSGSAEKLIEGVNQIHAEAAARNIHGKHGAIKACTEGSLRFSAMAQMLSRALSDMHYGPEITEPLAKASVHLQAAAMAFSEGDASLTTLLAMSVGDLANSPRQAPVHTEFAENGSH
jgi:hypothetical protein